MALLRGGGPGSGRAGSVRAACVHLPGGNRDRPGQSQVPGCTRAPRAGRQWVLGRGGEERRISAPNSICWRTWPAPRQAENSTYVRTCTQCWLCPRRALPSCCAPRSIPTLRLPPPAPRSPHTPPRGPGLGQGIFFFGSLEHPYFGKAVHGRGAGARSFHLQLLFTRFVRRQHPRRYHLDRARMSAAHGGS